MLEAAGDGDDERAGIMDRSTPPPMGAGSGPSTGVAPARRQWIAAALVLLSIPAGVAAGFLESDLAASWILAAAGLLSALVLLGGAPARGVSARPWRLLGLGVGVWAGGLAAVATTYEDGESTLSVPHVGQGPQLAGLALVAVAIGVMALQRAARHDWIARIDASIVGLGTGVGLAGLLWPDLRDAGLDGGAVAIGIGGGVLTGLLVGASVRLAITGASRLPAGRFAIEGALGLAAGSTMLWISDLGILEEDPGRFGTGLCVAAALVLSAAAIHPSASRITDREHRPAHDLSHARLAVLTLAAASAPACAVFLHLRDRPVDGLLLGGTSVPANGSAAFGHAHHGVATPKESGSSRLMLLSVIVSVSPKTPVM